MGVDGVANLRQLVRITGVAENLKNGDVNGKQSLGGIAGVALLPKKKPCGAFCFTGMAFIGLLEFGHEFVRGFWAGGQEANVFRVSRRSPDFERFADWLLISSRLPAGFTFHAIFGAAKVAELGGDFPQSGQVKFRVAGKFGQVVRPAIGGKERSVVLRCGAKHGREIGMIPGKISLCRAVVRHGDEECPAVRAIVRQPADDDVGRRQRLQPAQGFQRFVCESRAEGIGQVRQRRRDERLM